jgi:hypothetical protein
MQVLHWSGRSADALAVYDEGRRILADEVGIDPGPLLQTLHTQILRNELARPQAPLATATATGAEAAGAPSAKPLVSAPVPAQLPPSVPYFVGRGAELDRLNGLLYHARSEHRRGGGAVPITLITGTAGVGKSALAVHWAHQIRDHFPDGQLYVNLRGFEPSGLTMDPAEALGGSWTRFPCRRGSSR